MSRSSRVSRRQLALSLEHRVRQRLAEPTQEEVVTVLADLLLEALGEETDEQASEQRGGDDFEDYK